MRTWATSCPDASPSTTRSFICGLHLDVLAGGDALSVDDLFMAPEMHALVDRLRDTADIIFIVTSNVHDARSKALIDVADSVILEVVQGVSSYRDLYQASNDYTLVADKLLGVVYVANAVSRGRRAGRSAKPTYTPVRDTGEQASSGQTTSADSEVGSEREIAQVADVVPDAKIGPDECTGRHHQAQRRSTGPHDQARRHSTRRHDQARRHRTHQARRHCHQTKRSGPATSHRSGPTTSH